MLLMGDFRDWSPEHSGAASAASLSERPSSSSSSSSASSHQAAAVAAELGLEFWQRAEEVTQGIIAQVQPTVVSEERRKAVIDYVQRLIKNNLGCELQVFPFGSVPLKTYLPDGDIDLTAFGGLHLEEALASDVCSLFESEEKNVAAEFVVKDVQLIRAEVKLVKCMVQNIVVDISFNQLGGLCTLCFLEKIDRLIGKDHLFKRSIILIKAWCYYESRILGAHHGLISTYALETLVLYIFHLYHSSLNGPLAVLYKFLEYFSRFDWENYCISLHGPIRISSLPDFVVEAPDNGGGDLLLSNDFLKDCVVKFSAPMRGFETNSRTFPQKHLNIVDPLKENNNLGRSVSKGNFYRIKSAFGFGARRLGNILSNAEENIADELLKFFFNTLEGHGNGGRPDVQDTIRVPPMYNGFFTVSSVSVTESCQEDQLVDGPLSATSGSLTRDARSNHTKSLHMVGDVNVLGREKAADGKVMEPQGSNGNAVSEIRLLGDAKDLATTKAQGLRISVDTSKSSHSEGGYSPLGKVLHAPHLYFAWPSTSNRERSNGNAEWEQSESSNINEKNVSVEDAGANVHDDVGDNHLVLNREVTSPIGNQHPMLVNSASFPEEFYPGYSDHLAMTGSVGSHEVMNSLLDLSGDYESHRTNLSLSRSLYEYSMNVSVSPIQSPLVSQYQSTSSWDVIRQSVQYRQNHISPMNANGVVPRSIYYSMNPQMLHSAGFGMEEIPKTRGTGTYFPNTNHYRDRSSAGRGRNQALVRSPRNNGHIVTPPEIKSPERGSHEMFHTESDTHQRSGKSGSPDLRRCGSEKMTHSNAIGAMRQADRGVEFGSIKHLQFGAHPVDINNKQQNSGSPHAQNSDANHSTPGTPKSKPALGIAQDRMVARSYHLKNDDDFPPLSL